MDRLGFFKHGLSAATDVVGQMIGLKKAVDTFTEAVDEALSGIKSDIGLNLQSLQGDMCENPRNTLSDVAQMGYTMIETASYANGRVYDMKPEEFRDAARKAGLKIAGAHLTRLLDENPAASAQAAPTESGDGGAEAAVEAEDPALKWWAEALDTHRDMGCRYITMPSLPENLSDETTARYAAYFDTIGDMAAQRGMKFCFHPDKRHLTAENGTSAFDAIAAATDPAKVWFEIDTYETAEAGIDTKALLKRYGKRVLLLHAHDHGAVGESGRIDFDPIISEAIRCGAQDIFVEVRNYSLPPKNCAERSLYNLESLPSIKY